MSNKYFGAQDAHIKKLLENNITSFEDDFHKRFYENDYVCEYTKLDYNILCKTYRGTVVLLNTCDVISDINIVIPLHKT